MNDFDPVPYSEGIRELNRREQERMALRLGRARSESERLAWAIADADPTVRRVILFGSVASGAPSREDFDIDLAIDGGDSSLAMSITDESEFDVDLVNLELLPVAMRRMLENRGVELVRR